MVHQEISEVGWGVTAGTQNWSCSVHTGGCAHEQECPVFAMSHSAEKKTRSQRSNMVVWIWKHPQHQVISEIMTLVGKDLPCSARTKERLWTSVGLWVLHRETEMKNRTLLQIHIMLSFHLSPREHKGVYTVLSGGLRPSEQQQLDVLGLMSASGSSPLAAWVTALKMILCTLWVEHRTLRTAR